MTAFVRFALAAAALVAQWSVPVVGRECERACAARATHACCSAAVISTADQCRQDAGAAALVRDGGCCHADVTAGPHATNTTGGAGEPCRCRLEPRHDGSLPGHGNARPRLAADDAAAVPGAAIMPFPQSVHVSRDYLAASLSMPIRPTRILFGVWRN